MPYNIEDFLPPLPAGFEHCRWLSAAEESLWLAATRDWQTKRELVAKAGIKPDRDHAAILRIMVSRNILVAGPRQTYRLDPRTTSPAYPNPEEQESPK